MKSSIWNLSLALIVGFGIGGSISPCVHGQAPTGQSGSGTGAAACDNPPCATLTCGGEPCSSPPASIATGRHHAIPPMTPERAARIDEEKRYSLLFGSIGADEDMARREDAAGRPDEAASWRRDFARKSGLTPEEAEIVKKIAAQYRQDQVTLNAKCRADLLAMKPTFDAEHATGEEYSHVPSCDALKTLFPKAMADLLTALGSRSFSRLDGYSRHFLDNARVLSRQGQPIQGAGQVGPSDAAGSTEKPR
ncbi:MAG: hypothetical protein WCF30_10290 [Terracidiphilus sp.]